MSDYDRNIRDPRLNDPAIGDPMLESTRPTYQETTRPTYREAETATSYGSWVGGIIVALLLVAGATYMFSGTPTAGNRTVEGRAAATDTAPAPAPAKPMPAPAAPAPADQPK